MNAKSGFYIPLGGGGAEPVREDADGMTREGYNGKLCHDSAREGAQNG